MYMHHVAKPFLSEKRLFVHRWTSFYKLTILTLGCWAARWESMFQWWLNCTDLCLLIWVYFLPANKLKQCADL